MYAAQSVLCRMPGNICCAAHARGTVHLRPAPKKKAPLPEESVNTLVAVNRGEVLVVQRPAAGLLAGLWEFPEIDDPGGHQYAGSVTHTFTHKRITYHVFTSTTRARVRARDRERAAWLPVERLNDLALPTAQRKIARLVLVFD